MKRRELLRHLGAHGCASIREGSRHSWWGCMSKKHAVRSSEANRNPGYSGRQNLQGPANPEAMKKNPRGLGHGKMQACRVLLLMSFVVARTLRMSAGESEPSSAKVDGSSSTFLHSDAGRQAARFQPRPAQPVHGAVHGGRGPLPIGNGRWPTTRCDRHNPEHAPVDVDQWNAAPFDLRVGLTSRTEIDFLYDGYLNVRTRDHDAHTVRTQSGFGDLTLLFKYNLFGNDGGTFAFGILPYLKIPTNTAHLGNKSVEGGVELPLSINLPANFNLGLQTEFDAVRNDADTRYRSRVHQHRVSGLQLSEQEVHGVRGMVQPGQCRAGLAGGRRGGHGVELFRRQERGGGFRVQLRRDARRAGLRTIRGVFGAVLVSSRCHPERSESASAVEGPSGRRQPSVPYKPKAGLESDGASGGGRSFDCARGLAPLRMTEQHRKRCEFTGSKGYIEGHDCPARRRTAPVARRGCLHRRR